MSPYGPLHQMLDEIAGELGMAQFEIDHGPEVAFSSALNALRLTNPAAVWPPAWIDPVRDPADPSAQILTAEGWRPLRRPE